MPFVLICFCCPVILVSVSPAHNFCYLLCVSISSHWIINLLLYSIFIQLNEHTSHNGTAGKFWPQSVPRVDRSLICSFSKTCILCLATAQKTGVQIVLNVYYFYVVRCILWYLLFFLVFIVCPAVPKYVPILSIIK